MCELARIVLRARRDGLEAQLRQGLDYRRIFHGCAGQLGFFHKFASKDYEDKRPCDRYVAESKRLLGVLEQRLAGRRWVMGEDYTIADIAIFPWVRNLVGFYGAGELVEFDRFPQVQRVLAAFVERPAVQRGLAVPSQR